MKILQLSKKTTKAILNAKYTKWVLVLGVLVASSRGSAAEKTLLTCVPGDLGAPFLSMSVHQNTESEAVTTLVQTQDGLDFTENSNAFEWYVKDLTFPNVENRAYRLRLSSEGDVWTLVEYTIDNLEYYYQVVCQTPSSK